MAPSSPHAAHAARHLLDRLRAQGHEVTGIDDAIRQGLLTDMEWCDTLEEFRAYYAAHPVDNDEERERKRQYNQRYYQRRKEKQHANGK